MTAEQIAQVVMEAYDSSKEAKEYFEYFLNPDGAALCEKALTIIAKEIRKAKWGRSKGRVTVIREQSLPFRWKPNTSWPSMPP